MLTTSGDGTAHIWQCAVSLNNERPLGGSSEEELEWAGLEDTVRVSAPKSSIRMFVSTEKAPTRAFSWLKAATTAFTFKTLCLTGVDPTVSQCEIGSAMQRS